MRKIFIELLILLAMAAGVWMIFAYVNRMPSKPVLISTEAEEKLGEKYIEVVLVPPMFKISENDALDSLVGLLGEQLIKSVKEPKFNYQFFVIDNSMVNAFCLPGGNIVVTEGLLDYIDSAPELMAVMAHEIGHAEKRHVIQRLISELGLEIVTGGDNFIISELGKGIISSGYNRKQEEHADHYSCELMEAAQMEPRSLASFFRKLKAEKNNDDFNGFEMFASHPNFDSRIKNVLKYEVKDTKEYKSYEKEFKELKNLIN